MLVPMDRVVLLGVPIDPVTRAGAVARIRAMLGGTGRCHVMTPNNEMLVEARRNGPFRALLNRTALNVPDSTGLLWAARWANRPLPERVPGVDTVQSLCAGLDGSVGVFFLGAAPGVAERAAAALRAANPLLRVAGAYAGSPRPDEAKDIVDRINASGASLLLVAYGAPAQDLWIDAHLAEMPSVKVAMGVGGTFDFLAGTKKRAPAWMRSLGLEWLYRFAKEPSRWRRMWNAVVVFPWLVLTRGGPRPR
jgi:N-acetylglucosaminyldiphosphoundecaprenol N-acetyl-beta-D-mannosaminyltransferase